MKLDELQGTLVEVLRQEGIQAMASWPEERRTGPEGPVVLVSLEQLNCAPVGLQDYLGQWQDESDGQWKERYGRRAQMTFYLDVLAAPRVGAQACRAVLGKLVHALQIQKPAGLSVKELSGGELNYDEKEGLLRLRCQLECSGWLCTDGDEAGTFLDFTLRGDMNT